MHLDEQGDLRPAEAATRMEEEAGADELDEAPACSVSLLKAVDRDDRMLGSQGLIASVSSGSFVNDGPDLISFLPPRRGSETRARVGGPMPLNPRPKATRYL